MSSSNGTEYYLKSMNGIKVFDDGSGTVIEDDTITVKTITCENISANELSTTTFSMGILNTTSIQSATGNLSVNCDLTTTGTTKTNIISSLTGATGTIGLIGDVQATKIKSDYVEVLNNISCLNCSADDTLNCITLDADYVNISPLGNINTNTINSPFGILTITGQINLSNYYSFSGSNINGLIDGTTTYGIMNNITTANIRIGHAMTSGIIAIGNNKTSGDINIMNNVPSSGNINIGDNLNGAINLVRNSTTGGNVNIANAFKFYKDNIEFTNTTTSFNLFNNLISTKTINMGGAGTVNMSNLTVGGTLKTAIIQLPPLISSVDIFKDATVAINFGKYTFQDRSITTTNTTGDVSLFTNITGAVQIGSIIKIKGVEIYGGAINDTIGLLPTQTGGEIQIGSGLTTGAISLGNSITTGQINTCGNLIFKASTIISTGINNTINLFNNLTTGTLNIGGVGNVKVGNVFTFKSADITSSGINDTINVFNNITTGVINFCYGLTSAGTLQIGPGKIRHGSTNYYGYSRFLLNSTTATITVPIDIDYYVFCTGATATNLTLPTYITNQLITIRNIKTANFNVTILPATGQSMTGTNGATVTTFTLLRNTTSSFFSNGSTWYIF